MIYSTPEPTAKEKGNSQSDAVDGFMTDGPTRQGESLVDEHCKPSLLRAILTPASAEEQIEMLKKASRMKNQNSTNRKTQVHSKVDFVFYWANQKAGQKVKKVEIMGDFNNYKPVKMK